MTRRIVLVVALSLLAGSCGGADPTELGEIRLAAALTPFDSCADLLGHLRAEASARVGPYGLDGGPPILAFDDLAGAEATAEADGRVLPSTVPTTAPATSSTTTQEAFVDEPDVVKVAPERLLVVDDTTLRVIDLTGEVPVARGTVELAGWGHQLLVVGDRVLAIGGNGPIAVPGRDGAPADVAVTGGGEQATLSEVDVSDPDDPTVVHTLALDGAHLSARLVGDRAHVVVSAGHPAFPFVYPSTDGPEARRIAEAANRRLIESSTIQDWLPTATLDDAEVDVVTCDSIQRPADFSGFGFLTVLTVDLGAPLAVPPAASVLADGQTVYASGESLYVATSRPQPVGTDATTAPDVLPVETFETALHRFDLTGEGAAVHLASGVVPGHLLNQFSMSEHEGRLRVATTEGAPWSGAEDAVSRVAVLETEGDRLVEVGAVGGLGRTEQVYAVRFLGDTAYVVTFRQTDPLFVVDLGDPTAPTLRGELEVPGYSAYLHPLDEGHLLGIGQDADADGVTRGLQASVFDVTDPTSPTRVDHLVLPGAWSSAEYDHHAFLHWPATGHAVLPVGVDEALVLSVDADHVEEAGRVRTPGEEVRRNVVVGDLLLTIATDTLVTTDLTTLAPLARLPL